MSIHLSVQVNMTGITDVQMKLHGVTFKKRAPRAIKAIRDFAVKAMVSASIM